MPHRQSHWPLADLLVRSRQTEPTALVADVTRAVAEAVPGVEATGFATLEQILSRSISGPRFQALLLTLFAGLALALGAVGLYGVLSYLLLSRRQEIGVRLALGATPADIFRLALGEAGLLAMTGIALGLVAAWLLAQAGRGFLTDTLYGIGAADPLSLLLAVTAFLGVALLAGLPPAMRARRVDPIEVIRDE